MFFKRKSYSIDMLKPETSSNPDHYNMRSNQEDSIPNETIVSQTISTAFKPFLGLLYMFLHSTFNQTISVIVKKLAYIDPCQLSLIRNVSLFIGIFPITVYHTRQILGEKNDRLMLLIRGFFGSTGIYLQIIAYSYLPLAEASIVLSTLPIVTAAVARILLKESYGLIQRLTLIVTVCGVILALRIPKLFQNRNSINFDASYIAGLAAAIGNVLLLAFSTVYIRKLKKAHFSVLLIYLSVVGMAENSVINGIFIPIVPHHCGWDQILIILLGVATLLSGCFLTLGFQVEPAGLAAVQKSSFDILVIIAFQIMFFNLYPDFYVITGACLVIASMTILGIRNWVLMMPEASKARKYFEWLL